MPCTAQEWVNVVGLFGLSLFGVLWLIGNARGRR